MAVNVETLMRFDDMYFTMIREVGGIEGLIHSMFSFLFRRTDFYYECDPGDQMGFPPGHAAGLVSKVFKLYQDEHFKQHPPKSLKDYQAKLEAYKAASRQKQPSPVETHSGDDHERSKATTTILEVL